MVVSDHGMTDNGNHGGSSYEETDSLLLFIGPTKYATDYASASHNTAYQVVAETLCFFYAAMNFNASPLLLYSSQKLFKF